MAAVSDVAHRSYSQLTSWLRCGEAYRLERIKRVPQLPAWYLVGGTALHAATEEYDRNADRITMESDLLGIWHNAWAVAYSAVETSVHPDDWRKGGRATKDKPNKEDGAWWRDVAGPQYLRAYADWRDTYPNWRIHTTPDGRPGIETEFNVVFGDARVRAFIDRIFEVDGPHGTDLVIMDIKTGTREPDPFQLGVYAACYEKAYGTRPRLGCYWMARKGDITVPENLDVYSTELLDNMFSNFEIAVRNDIFIPHPGDACRICSVAQYCSAVGGELAHEAV